MKTYVKTIIVGIMVGALVSQLINAAVIEWFDRPFQMGGEILIPAVLIMVGYLGWLLADTYFTEVKYKDIYSKGFTEGVKINRYKIIIPIPEEKSHEKHNGSRIV